jgi:hypothetical protein
LPFLQAKFQAGAQIAEFCGFILEAKAETLQAFQHGEKNFDLLRVRCTHLLRYRASLLCNAPGFLAVLPGLLCPRARILGDFALVLGILTIVLLDEAKPFFPLSLTVVLLTVFFVLLPLLLSRPTCLFGNFSLIFGLFVAGHEFTALSVDQPPCTSLQCTSRARGRELLFQLDVQFPRTVTSRASVRGPPRRSCCI